MNLPGLSTMQTRSGVLSKRVNIRKAWSFVMGWYYQIKVSNDYYFFIFLNLRFAFLYIIRFALAQQIESNIRVNKNLFQISYIFFARKSEYCFLCSCFFSSFSTPDRLFTRGDISCFELLDVLMMLTR